MGWCACAPKPTLVQCSAVFGSLHCVPVTVEMSSEKATLTTAAAAALKGT